MEGGYWGKLLKVDLSKRSFYEEGIEEKELIGYLGGRGLAVRLLMREGREDLHPFDPFSPLLITTGPLTGLAPGTDRAIVAAKSPLTGIYIDECVEGGLGPSLKALGYDAIEVIGKSESPIYLLLTVDEVRFLDAHELWGLGVSSTISKLTKIYGRGSSILTIGPAGENLVRYAKVFGERLRPGGRGGLGAVMGSKGLKAIVTVVKGGGRGPRIADPISFNDALKRLRVSPPPEVGRMGRLYLLEELAKSKAILCRNFREAYSPNLEKFVSGLGRVIKGYIACSGCDANCLRVYATPSGVSLEGLDYASVVTLAFNNLIGGAVETVELVGFSLDLGLDPVSLGNIIGWAVELFERGTIDVNFTGDLKLRYGEPTLLKKLTKLTAYRRGFGALLAEGIRMASRIIGYGSSKLAVHVKGLEAPSLDPFKDLVVALSLMTSNKGGDLEEWPLLKGLYPRRLEEVAPTLVKLRSKINLVNSLIICPFLGEDLSTLGKLLSSITGWEDMDEGALSARGKLVESALRRFCLSANPKEPLDRLPERLASTEDASPLISRLEKALEDYYYIMGWGKGGKP